MGCASSSDAGDVRIAAKARLLRADTFRLFSHNRPPPLLSSQVTPPARMSNTPSDSHALKSQNKGDVATRRPFALTWELKEKLGKGQYATVYKVKNLYTGLIAAAKCILKAPLTKEDLEALAIEVKAMQLLSDNKNFVK